MPELRRKIFVTATRSWESAVFRDLPAAFRGLGGNLYNEAPRTPTSSSFGASAVQIEVVSDTICPWCYIGKRRLEKALRLRPHVRAAPKWRPFLLNPEMPPEGIDRALYLVRKFGSEARVRRMFGAISEAGSSEEIDFAFERIRRTPNSVDSHRLVRLADRLGLADAAVEALFFAYFVEGRNVGDRRVLVEVAAGVGLDAQEARAYLDSDEDVTAVYDENARAHRLGVNGVPSFIFNGRMVISGAQDPQVLARMIDAAEAAAHA
jgi:predicted DsbA family dithiol-disulfide isomerase